MKKKIMVVDDDPENNLSLKVGLEELDQSFEVICAESGSQFFQFLNEKELPDLVLLDIMMPNISGWEVFGELKKNPEWQKIPVIFLTARSDQMAKNAGNFLGEDYIEKPYELEEVKNRIDKILNKIK
ncbi:MAG: response regulator [Thermoplasmatales archaeon]|nr:response regulator [Thermoplasmatales archaeon]